MQMGVGKCLLSCLSPPSLPFHVLLSPFLSTNAPSCSSLPLFPMAPSASRILHFCLCPLWLCPSLALPLCPCHSHGPAVPSAPSHFLLLLPLPRLTLLLSLQTAGNPVEHFPTALTGAPAPTSALHAMPRARGSDHGISLHGFRASWAALCEQRCFLEACGDTGEPVPKSAGIPHSDGGSGTVAILSCQRSLPVVARGGAWSREFHVING